MWAEELLCKEQLVEGTNLRWSDGNHGAFTMAIVYRTAHN